MNQFTLKTKWVALAFAVLTLFTAYVVAGSGPAGTTPEVPEQPQADAAPAPQETAAPAPPVEDAADDTEFVDDGALIDEAGGEDPTPPDDGGGGGDDSGDDFAPANDGATGQ